MIDFEAVPKKMAFREFNACSKQTEPLNYRKIGSLRKMTACGKLFEEQFRPPKNNLRKSNTRHVNT